MAEDSVADSEDSVVDSAVSIVQSSLEDGEADGDGPDGDGETVGAGEAELGRRPPLFGTVVVTGPAIRTLPTVPRGTHLPDTSNSRHPMSL